MAMNKPTFRWIHHLMQQMNTEIGNTHVVPVSSPELAREFLTMHDAGFASRPDFMSARLTSGGYLAVALSPMGDQWKKMRGIVVSHVLSQAMHRWMHDKRVEEADHLVRYVYNLCRVENGLVDVRALTRHYCGNVMRKMVFGKRFFGPGLMEDGGPGYDEEEHVDALFKILSYLYAFPIGDYVPWLEGLDVDGHTHIITVAINRVRKYHDFEITKRVQMWKGGLRDRKEDILDVMIDLKNSENKPLLRFKRSKH